MSKNSARRSVKLLILLLICVISLSSVVKARPMPQQDDEKKTKKLPPRQFVRSRDFDMQHIALNLNFDWDKEQAFGTATMTLAPLVPDFKTINLDAGLMIINTVKLNGKDLKFEYDKSASALAINLDRIYKIGESLTFVVDYRTSGESVSNTLGFGGVNGLKFVKPTAENPNKRWQIWSQGETDYDPTISALTIATKDKNSLVRAAAIIALRRAKDTKYSQNFTAALNDQSYTVIDSAALALARTGDKNAYDALVKLANTDSWRDHIRVAGLQGLATLGDKRALDAGFKYADKSNSSNVRTNALGILAASGKGNARIYPLLLENFKQSLETNAFQGIFGGLQNFVKLADPRGQEAFDLAKDKFKENQNLLGFINQIEAQFKKAIEQK